MTIAISILLITLCASGTLLTLLGVYVFVKVLIMPNAPPADRTNRINHIRIVFFAIQHPEKFVSVCRWLKNDEADNVQDNY